MSIYHLMGLGFYIGAVTSPLAYIAERIQRNNEFDKIFLRRFVNPQNLDSDFEAKALILFTTPDVLAGQSEREPVYGYTLNPYVKLLSPKERNEGKTHPEIVGEGKPGRELLEMALRDVSKQGRSIVSPGQSLNVYWCICPLGDMLVFFERISLVLETLRAEAQEPHHIWACMNGGVSNISSSLQLALNLSPLSVRQYSRFQENNLYALFQDSDKYWVDQPLLALGFSEFNRRLKLYAPNLVEGVEAGDIQKGHLHGKLCAALVDHFSPSELEQLLFEMGIRLANIEGWRDATISKLVQELILYCERRDLLADLIIHARIARPNIRFDEIIMPSQSPEWLLMSVVTHFGKQGVKIDEARKVLEGFIKRDAESFEQILIEPMAARGYLIRDGDILSEGSEWESTSAYFKAQIKAQSEACLTLDELARNHESKSGEERWFYKQTIYS